MRWRRVENHFQDLEIQVSVRLQRPSKVTSIIVVASGKILNVLEKLKKHDLNLGQPGV